MNLPILVLDVAHRCNCRCIMCDIWKRDSTRYLQQLPDLAGLNVQWVVLTGGEPLMHPDLFPLCEALKAASIRITLLTTGLLLERFAAQISNQVDDLIISLDGPPPIHDKIRRIAGAFDRISAGVRALRSHRPRFPISARSTVQPMNCAHLSETVAAARDLGSNSISFLAIDTHSQAFDHSSNSDTTHLRFTAPEIAQLTCQIEHLVASGECGRFIVESPDKLRRIIALSTGESSAPKCNAPWVSAVVDSGGEVRPCFFHPPLGRISPDRNLHQVLNSPEAIRFRDSLEIASNPICRRCVCSLHWRETSLTDNSHLPDDSHPAPALM